MDKFAPCAKCKGWNWTFSQIIINSNQIFKMNIITTKFSNYNIRKSEKWCYSKHSIKHNFIFISFHSKNTKYIHPTKQNLIYKPINLNIYTHPTNIIRKKINTILNSQWKLLKWGFSLESVQPSKVEPISLIMQQFSREVCWWYSDYLNMKTMNSDDEYINVEKRVEKSELI